MADERIEVGADPAHFAWLGEWLGEWLEEWLEERLYEHNVQATGIDGEHRPAG